MSDANRDELRRQMRQQRQALAAPQRMAAAAALLEQLQSLPDFLGSREVGIYFAVRGELPLSHVLLDLRRRGQRAWLPVLADDGLAFAPCDSASAMQANRFGIPEPVSDLRCAPAQLDLVLCPLLAFDRHGARLGTGGGWYDRSFAFLRDRAGPAKPLLVGVGYAFQERSELALAAHDVRLDFVVTEQELIRCRPEAAPR